MELNFQKSKDYLVCIDSDGCVMDTMDMKHALCFGPCMIKQWKLEPWRERILRRWNEVNLYSMTRGINRFKGLGLVLSEVNDTCCEISGLEIFEKWLKESDELSEHSLEQIYREKKDAIFFQVLSWSKEVNRAVKALSPELKKPFPGVLKGMEAIHPYADIAVVSSANPEAVAEEWGMHGLLPLVDIALAQDAGSKTFCIGELIKFGYAPSHVLMIGDAPGDLDAARKNGVLFYPILVKREEKSWKVFREEALAKFLENQYQGTYQEELILEFEHHLK